MSNYDTVAGMRLSVSLPDGLAERVTARAASEQRPVSNMIAVLLEAALAETPDYSGVRFDRDTLGAKPFRGPDPRKK